MKRTIVLALVLLFAAVATPVFAGTGGKGGNVFSKQKPHDTGG